MDLKVLSEDGDVAKAAEGEKSRSLEWVVDRLEALEVLEILDVLRGLWALAGA